MFALHPQLKFSGNVAGILAAFKHGDYHHFDVNGNALRMQKFRAETNQQQHPDKTRGNSQHRFPQTGSAESQRMTWNMRIYITANCASAVVSLAPSPISLY